MKLMISKIRAALLADNASGLTLLLCLLVAVVAVWHALDFSHDFDPEFPGMNRDHYSRYAPFAYRLAEPGDTLDLASLYMSAAGIGLLALLRLRPEFRAPDKTESRARLALLGVCFVGFWLGSCPDPTMDAWHGLAPAALFRVSTPVWERALIALIALCIGALIILPIAFHGKILVRNSSFQSKTVDSIAITGFLWRIINWPDPEPWGYWPRWAMIVCMVVILSKIANRLQSNPLTVAMSTEPVASRKSKRRSVVFTALLTFTLIQAGYYLHWLHWPMARFKAVIPGQLYVSAMPSPYGLKLAFQRHHFKTIINLFNEDTPQRHPNFPAELKFAQENGIKYIRAEGKNYGNRFIESTFEAARDPENWPVLVHCHGNMDRTPAWLGMYRFRYQGWRLDQILAAIERHRGYRPKGGTTVLYCDLLPKLAPEQWAADPVAARLKENASGYTQPDPHNVSAIAGQKPNSARK